MTSIKKISKYILLLPLVAVCSCSGTNTSSTTSSSTFSTSDTSSEQHVHTYGNYVSVDDTNHQRVCTGCSHVELEKHVIDQGEVIFPTCTEQGYTLHHCMKCSYTVKTDYTNPTGHKYDTNWSRDDTSHWHAATCGHDLKSGLADHSFDEGVIAPGDEPTCSKKGRKLCTCGVCGYQKYFEVPMISHTFPEEYESNENDHWKVCSVCEGHSDHEEHSWGMPVIIYYADISTKPATPGLKELTCTVCGRKTTEPTWTVEGELI